MIRFYRLKMALQLLQKVCNIQYSIFKSIANLQYSIVQFLKLLQLQQQYQKPIEYCNFCNIHYCTVSLPYYGNQFTFADTFKISTRECVVLSTKFNFRTLMYNLLFGNLIACIFFIKYQDLITSAKVHYIHGYHSAQGSPNPKKVFMSILLRFTQQVPNI